MLAASCFQLHTAAGTWPCGAQQNPKTLPLSHPLHRRFTNKQPSNLHAARRQRCPISQSISSASTAATGAVEEYTHTLPDGMRMEVLRLPVQGTPSRPRPPLVFIHGSYHGAWCWRENFMPYFAAAGYDTYAISLRGQGGSERGELKVSGTIKSMADDVATFLATLPQPAVLVGHSFGGIVVERYLLDLPARNPPLAGVACLASVPPTGNYDIVVRVTKKSLIAAWKITWAFVGKSFARSAEECRYTFFSPDLPQAKLDRYQKQLAACSPVRMLDLSALRKDVPLPPLPASLSTLPAYVGGGDTDIVVDLPAIQELADWFGMQPPNSFTISELECVQAVQELADWFGVQPVVWRGVAHDCMLDTRWEEVASSLREWLDGI